MERSFPGIWPAPTHPFLATMIVTQMKGWFGVRSLGFGVRDSDFCILRLPELSPFDEIFRNAG